MKNLKPSIIFYIFTMTFSFSSILLRSLPLQQAIIIEIIHLETTKEGATEKTTSFNYIINRHAQVSSSPFSFIES